MSMTSLPWPDAVRGLLIQANAHLSQQHTALAVPLLQQALTQVADLRLRHEIHHRLIRAWIKLGHLDQARSAIAQIEATGSTQLPPWLDALAWRLNLSWWTPCTSARLRVRRPLGSDAAWLKQSFAHEAFGSAVNRDYSARIAATSVDQVERQLEAQRQRSPVDMGSHLLVIEHLGGQRVGIASFVNLDEPSRRAEFIIGFPGEPPHSLLVFEAGMLLADLAFVKLQLHKVCASIYSDNPRLAALASMLSQLGFDQEGTQREHVRLPDGRFVDVHLWGALRHRLLGHPLMRKYAQRFLHQAWGGPS